MSNPSENARGPGAQPAADGAWLLREITEFDGTLEKAIEAASRQVNFMSYMLFPDFLANYAKQIFSLIA